MIVRLNHKRRGSSLTELAIVLGVIGVIIGGIWTYAGSARQAAKVEQSVEAISLVADSTRAAYTAYVNAVGVPGISGGIETVVPYLVKAGAFPPHLLKSTPTTCNAVPGNYANTPWSGADVCGTLRVCAWALGTNTACGVLSNPAASQYFAIEFTALNYQSCLSLATRATPTSPTAGLADVYVNGTASGGLPLTPSAAGGKCIVGGTTNIVDFIYALRPPPS